MEKAEEKESVPTPISSRGVIRGGRTTWVFSAGVPEEQVKRFAKSKGGGVKEVEGGKEVKFVGRPIETTLSTGVRIVDVPPGTPQSEVMEKIITKGGIPVVGSSETYEGGIKGGQRYVLPPKENK